MTIAAHRYRTLLEVFSTVTHQPTVKAVLQSLRGVLSSSSGLHGAHVYVLSSDGEALQMLEFDQESDAPEVKAGTKVLRIGAVAQVLEEQKPVLVPDVSLEMSKHLELAPFAAQSVGRPTYAFPVSRSRNNTEFLQLRRTGGKNFTPTMLSGRPFHQACRPRELPAKQFYAQIRSA
jgi:transcriptional regulator with GAF, ATPase, and Fis domain